MRSYRRRGFLASAAAARGFRAVAARAQGAPQGTLVPPDLILTNGRFATLDRANPSPEAVAVAGGRFSAMGAARDILPTGPGRTRASSTSADGGRFPA